MNSGRSYLITAVLTPHSSEYMNVLAVSLKTLGHSDHGRGLEKLWKDEKFVKSYSFILVKTPQKSNPLQDFQMGRVSVVGISSTRDEEISIPILQVKTY